MDITGGDITYLVDHGEFRLYPNPAGSTLKVESTLPLSKVELLDARGILVEIYQMAGRQGTMDLGDHNQGVYILKIHPEKGNPVCFGRKVLILG